METASSAEILRVVEEGQAISRMRAEMEAAARREVDHNVLVPASPSPRKKRSNDGHSGSTSTRQFYDPTQNGPPPTTSSRTRNHNNEILASAYPTAKPPSNLPLERPRKASNLLSGLKSLSTVSSRKEYLVKKEAARSDSFLKPEGNGKSSVNSEGSSISSKLGREKGKDKVKEKKPKEKEEVRLAREAHATRSTMIMAPTVSKSQPASSKAQSQPRPRPKQEEHFTESEEEDDDDSDDLDIVDKPKTRVKRRMDGTVIEEIELGPKYHATIPGDPDFETIEPNSGIRLKRNSRKLSHDQVQSYLENRYHLTPSLIYSLSRSLTHGSNSLHVEVEGGFVVIGVVAAKSEPMLTRGKLTNWNSGSMEDEKKKKNTWSGVKGAAEGEEEDDERTKGKKEVDPMYQRGGNRSGGSTNLKYIRFTIVDLATVDSAASGTGTLFLTMFQSEHVDVSKGVDGEELRSYRGGSGGAYEAHWKLEVGSVVAILNPSVSKSAPKPGQNNVYFLSPRGADSIAVIAQAKDLRHCEAIRRDTGQACGDWCDARVHMYCSFHVERNLKKTQASRPETSSTSASMSHKTMFNKTRFENSLKPGGGGGKTKNFDPVNKVGLLPRNRISIQEGSTTYVTSSTGLTRPGPSSRTVLTAGGQRTIVTNSGPTHYVPGVRDGPTVKQAKKDRENKKLSQKLERKFLRELVKTDGGKTVAGGYLKKTLKRAWEKKEGENGTGKGEGKKRKRGEESESESESESDEEGKEKKKRPFSNVALRRIGFDPTAQGEPIWADEDDHARRKRLEAISQLSSNIDRKPVLSAPPGPKIRSVRVPVVEKARISRTSTEDEDDLLPDLDISHANRPKTSTNHAPPTAAVKDMDSDDDLIVEGGPPGSSRRIVPPRSKTTSPKKLKSPAKSPSRSAVNTPAKSPTKSPTKGKSPIKRSSPHRNMQATPPAVADEVRMDEGP